MKRSLLMVFLAMMLLMAGCGNQQNATVPEKDHAEKANDPPASREERPIREEPAARQTDVNDRPSTVRKTLTEQDKAINMHKARDDFLTRYRVDASHLTEPFLYDINNDGQDDIILSNEDAAYYNQDVHLAVYDLQDGALMTSKVFKAEDHNRRIEFQTIKNPTYDNCIAAMVTIYGGNIAYVETEIYTVRRKDFMEVGKASADGEWMTIEDVDQDGYEELTGVDSELYEPGSDRIPHAEEPYVDTAFVWGRIVKLNATAHP